MKIYFVANDNGDIAGHDLDFARAEQVLCAMLKEDPENSEGREIIDECGEY